MVVNKDMRRKQKQMLFMSSCRYLHSESKAVTGSALTSLFNLKGPKRRKRRRKKKALQTKRR